MFDDLLEAWDALLEGRGSSPEQRRLSYRLAVGKTKQAAGQTPPPTPGTAGHRRKTLLKSMGIKSMGMSHGVKGAPPAPIPKGSVVGKTKKGQPIDLAGSKGESIFGGDLFLWEDCGCGCNGKKGGCGKAKKAKKDLDEFGYWT